MATLYRLVIEWTKPSACGCLEGEGLFPRRSKEGELSTPESLDHIQG